MPPVWNVFARSRGVAAGTFFTAVLETNGTVVAWGDSVIGKTDVPFDLRGVTAISASASHTVVLRTNGTVLAWGNPNLGALNIPPGLNDVMAIAAGDNFTLALKSNGTVVAWGYNNRGQTNVPPDLNGISASPCSAMAPWWSGGKMIPRSTLLRAWRE